VIGSLFFYLLSLRSYLPSVFLFELKLAAFGISIKKRY
jgi:hypothetical protein